LQGARRCRDRGDGGGWSECMDHIKTACVARSK
jgi:hypothetical protein